MTVGLRSETRDGATVNVIKSPVTVTLTIDEVEQTFELGAGSTVRLAFGVEAMTVEVEA